MEFTRFRAALQGHFSMMSSGALFCTDVEKDELWDTYLKSFPKGTNPIFRERTVHDCVCCKQFIRLMGNVVGVRDNTVVSLWDADVQDDYSDVARKMADLVKSRPIREEFLHFEKTAGRSASFEQKEGVPVTTWDHFYLAIPHASNSGPNFVCPEHDIATRLGEGRSLHDSFKNGLEKLSLSALETVSDLIGRKAFYKSEENAFVVNTFRAIKRQYDDLEEDQKDGYCWTAMRQYPASVTKIRGTSIGTLIEDIAGGRDLEGAVTAFEKMVAPGNYKRTTALVTQKQVDAAQKTLDDLGLTSALERRYATLSDISVRDILFVDRAARKLMRNNAFEGVATKPAAKSVARVEEVPIETFIKDVLPRIESLEAFVGNNHASNLMSLIAPVDPKALDLFKWNNGFSWTYTGDVTDSIKERVKKAGGNVTGDLCCRLAWSNKDDLDLHLIEPNGDHIYFGNRRSPSEGELDVDKNVINPVRDPVENIFYKDQRQIREGRYRLFVNNFKKRESTDVGFTVEIDFLGTVTTFHYPKAVREGENIEVALFTYSRKNGFVFTKTLPSSEASKVVWGLKTQDFHKVNTMMLSPNYWGEQGSGNKHYFFMLDGCQNDGSARGFYNEYLKPDLNQHRKVLEIVGSKMRTEQSSEQLSGLGFSSTQHNKLLVRTKGALTRTMEIVF